MALKGLEKIGHDNGEYTQPMGTHDVDFIESETKHHMDQHVECPERQGKPHQTRTPTTPYSTKKEQYDKGFNYVVDGKPIVDDERTGAKCVLQKVVLMQLNGFTEEVFNNT